MDLMAAKEAAVRKALTEVHTLHDVPRTFPIPYEEGPHHTTSVGTRPPGFYDLHLHDDLCLKRVVNSRALTKKLCDLYHQHISKDTLTSTEADGFNIRDVFSAAFYDREDINNEQDLMKDYLRRTGDMSLPLASEIIRDSRSTGQNGKPNQSNKFKPCLRWNASSLTRNSALADLYLEPKLLPEMKQDYKLLERNNLKQLAFIEGKNLRAGDLTVMQAIARFGSGDRKFAWIKCGCQNFSPQAQFCGSGRPGERHLNSKDEVSQTGRKTGPDTGLDWWEVEDGQLDDIEAPAPADRDSAYVSEEDMKAAYIIQQVWAELVAADITFGVISSGNYEIFARRHRDSGTLYLSEILMPSSTTKTPHYVLHTGLCLAAFLDAIARARLMQDLYEHKSDDDYTSALPWWDRYSRNYDYDGHASSYKNAAFTKTLLSTTAVKKDRDRRFLEVSNALNNANSISITLPPSASGDPGPFLFNRKKGLVSDKATPKKLKAKPLKQALASKAGAVNLTSTDCKSLKGSHVWQARITAGEDSSQKFVMKLAVSDSAKSRLLVDYKFYYKPSGARQHFAPHSFGIFDVLLPSGSEWYIHITEHKGDNLTKYLDGKNKGCDRDRRILRAARPIILGKVNLFHTVTHSLHNNLTGGNVLIEVEGTEVTGARLINFADGEKHVAQVPNHTWEEAQRRDRAFLTDHL